MVRPEAQLLRDYLRAVRRVALRRSVGALIIDGALFVALWSILVVGVCGLTLRGDLGATVGGTLGALVVGALVNWRFREARGWVQSAQTLARAISRAPGPLRQVATAREREDDVILRHEILGATELWRELEDGEHELRGERSPELAAAYVHRVGIATLELDPSLALPRPRRGPRTLAALLALGLATSLALAPMGSLGLGLLLAAEDGRPPPPPQPVWTSLVLVLDYPEHTRRPDRRVPNPSGAIRVPAGTRVSLDLRAAAPAKVVRLVMVHDRLSLASAPEPELIDLISGDLGSDDPELDDEDAARRWTGHFTVRGPGSWVVTLLDDPNERDPEALTVAARRSAPMRIELEPDAMPEVELLPLPDWQRDAVETDRIDLRFTTRDDFGVVNAELVYEMMTAEGELERHRLPAGKAPGQAARAWRHRYSWDLSAIPIERRSAITYWIEVRDNDPGLGLTPLRDGPGKVAASARQQLRVHDEEAEHATNIRDLQTIRDAAVDLLAARLTSDAFADLDREVTLRRKLRAARGIHEGAATLLTMIAVAVDALAVDTMIEERDVEALAAIHERLLKLHREEAQLHEAMPTGSELGRELERAPLLRELGAHNVRERTQLEDEIIRLDDLVDGQIIDHIETLVARLQASQQKLVEKLEQLASGDESVRAEIEQLQQRIREDMRRVQEARAQLRKEVGDEWMNLDAFKAMEARMRSQELLEQLARGDVDGALQQARDQLEAIRSLRDQVQRSGAEAEAVTLSEEDRQRMKMLRELSRLQDEQTGTRGETRRLDEQWRDAVSDRPAGSRDVKRAGAQAEQLREAIDDIDDTNLSREGRRGWEDAREALETLEAATEDGQAGELELFEAAREATRALERARAGARAGEAEGKALRKLAREAQSLRDQLRAPLPDPREVLDPDQAQRLSQLGERQRALRDRARRLLEDPAAAILPEIGREAMERADQGMREAGESLDDAALDHALDGEERAHNALQQAIDSLRQSAPPPPPPSGGGDSSTEAERDRSLRDQVVEAMREGDRDGFDEDTLRYYEELLR